jgi:hypothetical protein
MLWIVQNNLYNEAGYARFIKALERLGVDYLIVKPVPFTNKILPADYDSWEEDFDSTPELEIDANQKIMICGATSLSRIADAKGWNPGTYLNDNFDFSKWRDGFGKNNILNGDARVGLVKNITIPAYDYVFVRPVHDTKSFSGITMSEYDLDDWLKSISQIEEEEFVPLPLHKNTEIMISSVKTIISEYRMFIVDGKVVTGSMYKRGNQVIANEYVEPLVYEFTQRMVGEWQGKVDCRIIPSVRVPADAFVMDIAVTPFGMKVIEINNINSAGFYAADVQKIIMAIEDLER